jgi:hypothetical protein
MAEGPAIPNIHSTCSRTRGLPPDSSGHHYFQEAELAQREEIARCLYVTTYVDTLGKHAEVRAHVLADKCHRTMRATLRELTRVAVQEKSSKDNLEILTIHRGKRPPEHTHNAQVPPGLQQSVPSPLISSCCPQVAWNNTHYGWTHAPNIKANFVNATWGSNWGLADSGSSGSSKDRFAQTSRCIGAGVINPPASAPTTLTALEDLGFKPPAAAAASAPAASATPGGGMQPGASSSGSLASYRPAVGTSAVGSSLDCRKGSADARPTSSLRGYTISAGAGLKRTPLTMSQLAGESCDLCTSTCAALEQQSAAEGRLGTTSPAPPLSNIWPSHTGRGRRTDEKFALSTRLLSFTAWFVGVDQYRK